MDPRFAEHLRFVNRIHLRTEFSILALKLLRSIVLALLAISIWAFIKPESPKEQLVVGFVSLIFFLIMGLRWSPRRLNALVF